MNYYKLQLIILLLFMSTLTACDDTEEPLVITSDSVITMENLDDYMYRDDVQYVDLRNFDAKFQSGYIDSFENIPFFEYLDYRVFDRDDTYEFNADQLKNTAIMESLFKRDKAIFLYADGCIRSGYVKDVLMHLGYDKVFVIGGYYEYDGDYKILGDGEFQFGRSFYTIYTDQITFDQYIFYGTLDMGQKIQTIRFDLLSDNTTLRTPDSTLDLQYTLLEEHIISEIITFNELYDLILDTTSSFHSIEGYTQGYSSELVSLIEKEYIE